MRQWLFRHLGIAILAAATVLGGAVLAIGATNQKGATAPDCIHSKPQKVSSGIGPKGIPWGIRATVKPNDSCKSWLLSVSFLPFAKKGPSWRSGIGIEKGGILPSDFAVRAQDIEGPAASAFSGLTGSSMRKIIVRTGDGDSWAIRPRPVSRTLQSHFVWLRGLRYFMRFYPLGAHVTSIVVKDSRGKVAYRGRRGAFGNFQSP
jgi:hypothetical protein